MSNAAEPEELAEIVSGARPPFLLRPRLPSGRPPCSSGLAGLELFSSACVVAVGQERIEPVADRAGWLGASSGRIELGRRGNKGSPRTGSLPPPLPPFPLPRPAISPALPSLPDALLVLTRSPCLCCPCSRRSQDSTPLIDMEILQQLQEMDDDDDEREFSRSIVDEFREQVPEQLAIMKKNLCVLPASSGAKRR